MVNLPPVETAQIDSSHLQVPVEPRREFRFPKVSFTGKSLLPAVILFALAAPLSFAWASQPSGPQINQSNRELISAYLDDSGKTGEALLADQSTAPSPTPTVEQQSPEESALAQLASSGENGTYAYQLSLAQGFLVKAVTQSQATSQGQSESDRQAILAYLQQALDAANKAIEMAPTQGLGFLVRARVYKTASAVKTEFAPLAEQDLVIARALGINGDALAAPNPLEHLPTVVAAPEEGSTASVSTETATNVQSGRITLTTGNRTVDVSFPGLSPQLNLRVDPVNAAQNSNNAVFTVVSRQEGVGFTVQSTAPAPQDIELEWRAIAQ